MFCRTAPCAGGGHFVLFYPLRVALPLVGMGFRGDRCRADVRFTSHPSTVRLSKGGAPRLLGRN